MDRSDFISKIIALYPHAIKDFDAYFDTYKRALKSSLKIDFEKLADLFAEEYKDNFPPAPGVLAEMAQRCLIEKPLEAKKILHVKVFNPMYNAITNTDCFPAGTTQEQMLNFFKKSFPKFGGWRIVEVY